MKRLFVLLLALTILSGAVFAQASINGYVRSIGTYNVDADIFDIANRLRLNLSWTSADESVTFGARIQNDGTGFAIPNYMYGQINLAGGKVIVSGGRLWNFDYDISSGLSDYYIGNVENGTYGTFYEVGAEGMLFQFLPVDGLNIGLLLRPNEADAGLEEFGLGIRYTIGDIGDFVLTAIGATAFEDTDLSASFVFTKVENLSVAAGYKGLSAHGVYGVIDYSMDALTIQVAPEFNITNEWFYVEGTVQYILGDLTLMANFAVDPDVTYLSGKYFLGAEVIYAVGQGQIAFNPYYEESVGFSMDVVVRVSF